MLLFALDSIGLVRTMFLLCSHRVEARMFRAVIEEAAALTSIALFLGMIAIWAQVIATL
jgi:hypothetical protein